jgi:hypothetical protein
MRRAGLVLVALLLVSAAALEALRARLESSDSLREGFEAAVLSQLGMQLVAGAFEVSFWPPRLRLAEPVLVIPAWGHLALGPVESEVDLASWLKGNLRLLALRARGPARIRLGGLALDAELSLELEQAERPLAWSLQAEGALTHGGSFSLGGGWSSLGGFEGVLELTEIESAPFAPFLKGDGGEPAALSGRYSGSLELARDSGWARLRLASPEAHLDISGLRLQGPIALVAQLPAAERSTQAGGRFQIDATRARIDYVGGPAQGAARGGSLAGRILRSPQGGFRLEEVGLTLRRFRGQLEERMQRADGS